MVNYIRLAQIPLLFTLISLSVWVFINVCVCVCEREREREREGLSVFFMTGARQTPGLKSLPTEPVIYHL